MDIASNVIKTIGLYLFLIAVGIILGGIMQSSLEEKVVNSTLQEIRYENPLQQLSDWQTLQLAIMKTESEFNILAKNGEYLGLMQEGKVFVNECNRIVGEDRWTYLDAFIPDKAVAMFNTYQDYHNPLHSCSKAIELHNPGAVAYAQKVLKNVEVIKNYENIRKAVQEGSR